MEAAPFFGDVADAAPDACAFWTRAPDGVRLRLAELGRGTRGTVLLFPGRTECVEKYGPTGRALAARGYGTLAIDWQGQGLSDRFLPDPETGHVERFDDYQRDVGAMLDAAQARDLPRPWHLLAHSMGGAIGLRALLSGLPVASAVFTGPMWDIALPPLLRPAAWTLTTLARPLRQGHRVPPTVPRGVYLLEAPFEGNLLTTDRDTYAWMQAQLRAHPELGLGGPSLAWLGAALDEIRALARAPSPDLPCLCVCGENERIVDLAAIRARMARWPKGRLVIEPGAEHEVLMERAEIRTRTLDGAVALFDAQRA
jgi:lysophospholipase